MMRTASQAFAGALRGFLILAVVVAVPAAVLVLTSSSLDAEKVVATWKAPASSPSRLLSTGNVAILAFLIIPVAAYGALLTWYGPNRQWPYLTMAVLQLVILLSVAIGVV